MKPSVLPGVPMFSSGPSAKRPGWDASALKDAAIGRSHRSELGKQKLQDVITRTASLLGLPEGWRIAIVPGSDTGAFEMAMWSLLGKIGVDILVWESFGKGWATDVCTQLKLKDVRVLEAEYGDIPRLEDVDFSRDVIFTWNGTTSGACLPGGDWIAPDREGLTLCDATSAVFAQDLAWEKLDVATFSWQKVLGGEAGHGMIVLGPRAIDRLENHTPLWPIPKVFRLTSNGKFNGGLFKGETINTPSMLCVEDVIDALKWAESIGGLKGLRARADANLGAITHWIKNSNWAAFLVEDPLIRSNTSICIKIVDPWFTALEKNIQTAIPKRLNEILQVEGAAFDINSHRDAPSGLRIWGGSTIETSDVKALLPWLDWGYMTIKTYFLESNRLPEINLRCE